MGETQTILKKFETNARKRLAETKELLKGLLNKQKTLETEKAEDKSEESEWDYK
jgi:hypothetical protein